MHKNIRYFIICETYTKILLIKILNIPNFNIGDRLISWYSPLKWHIANIYKNVILWLSCNTMTFFLIILWLTKVSSFLVILHFHSQNLFSLDVALILTLLLTYTVYFTYKCNLMTTSLVNHSFVTQNRCRLIVYFKNLTPFYQMIAYYNNTKNFSALTRFSSVTKLKMKP